MKLSELRSAIRGSSGNPLVEIVLGSISVVVPVQKTAFDKAIAAAFDGQRTVETGIAFDSENNLIHAVGGGAPQIEQGGEGIDLDDEPAASGEDFDLDI